MIPSWPRRTLAFAGFTLREYRRSWRFLVELVAAAAFLKLFLWPEQRHPLELDYAYSTSGLFLLGLSGYTAIAMMGLGNRRVAYLLLIRHLGRTGYLAGLALAALAVSTLVYLFICVALFLLYQVALGLPIDLTVASWLVRSLLLLLAAGIVVGYVVLLAPLVTGGFLRVALVGLLGLATSSMDPRLYQFAEPLRAPAQLAFSALLLPPMSGFAAAAQPGDLSAVLQVVAAQALLLCALFGLALYLFNRRDLILP